MKIALVGNQNSGKTTLFNYLTGLNAKIGNWPGVTIEKKVGTIKGTNYELIDLPGIYSLSPYSIEEELSRKFIFEEKPDVIINIIDSNCLERSLYLTTQLLELDCKVIIALNMTEKLLKKGIRFDIEKFEQQIGTSVVEISALKGNGTDELIKEIGKPKTKYRNKIFDDKIENAILKIEGEIYNQVHKKFIAVKLLEKDNFFVKQETKEIENIRNYIQTEYDTDMEEIIATQRYSAIEKIKKNVLSKKIIIETISDKLDKIFLNKWLAFPIFALIMFLVYYVSVGIIGNLTVDLILSFINKFGQNTLNFLVKINTSQWIQSLVVEGIIMGVGTVLSFIPQLIILFICISLLETTGYMSRIALLLDNLFRRIGLSGKSLIPFIIGSGCSVPGIMGTRIIENQDEREMAIILTPFIPCSAKLPIIALFSGYFFGENSGLISASLYFFAILIIIISAIFMKKFVFKHTSSTYISELPEYKIPSLKYVCKDVIEKILEFIKRAGSTIFICSIILWFLLSFSLKLEYGVAIENSILALIGKKISWIFYPILGVNSWEATVSATQGLIAKEQVISSMSVIAGLDGENLGINIFSNGGVFSFFTCASAYSFLVFNLFSAPCLGAIGAMKRELGSTKKVIKAIAYQCILAWFLSSLIYKIGCKIEKNIFNFTDVIILFIIIFLIIKILNKKNTIKQEDGCSRCPYTKSCNKRISNKVF